MNLEMVVPPSMTRTSVGVPLAAACLLLAGEVPNELAYPCHRRANNPKDSYLFEVVEVEEVTVTEPSTAAVAVATGAAAVAAGLLSEMHDHLQAKNPAVATAVFSPFWKHEGALASSRKTRRL